MGIVVPNVYFTPDVPSPEFRESRLLAGSSLAMVRGSGCFFGPGPSWLSLLGRVLYHEEKGK